EVASSSHRIYWDRVRAHEIGRYDADGDVLPLGLRSKDLAGLENGFKWSWNIDGDSPRENHEVCLQLDLQLGIGPKKQLCGQADRVNLTCARVHVPPQNSRDGVVGHIDGVKGRFIHWIGID